VSSGGANNVIRSATNVATNASTATSERCREDLPQVVQLVIGQKCRSNTAPAGPSAGCASPLVMGDGIHERSSQYPDCVQSVDESAVTALTEQRVCSSRDSRTNVHHRGGERPYALPRAAEHVLRVAALGRMRAVPAVAFKAGVRLDRFAWCVLAWLIKPRRLAPCPHLWCVHNDKIGTGGSEMPIVNSDQAIGPGYACLTPLLRCNISRNPTADAVRTRTPAQTGKPAIPYLSGSNPCARPRIIDASCRRRRPSSSLP
jgi:hypothetical protein